jgi:transketolase
MQMNKSISELEQISLKVREHIIRMATDGGCFLGASLSCADLIVFLYYNYLNISANNLKDSGRDYLFLSKGHDVPALYATFAELGFIDKERLKNHLKTNDFIYWHPNVHIPGVEFHSGSLGHLLSVSMGTALDCKLCNKSNKVVVILGDGELNEGSIWEGSLVASAKKLDNLIAIVDRNKFQANLPTEELIPIEPIDKKFEAFGWNVFHCNGHDYKNLKDVFTKLPLGNGRPTIVIADTKRGKGLPSIEERADRWFCNFTKEEIDLLLKELYSKEKSNLTSETLVVR